MGKCWTKHTTPEDYQRVKLQREADRQAAEAAKYAKEKEPEKKKGWLW